MRTPFALFAALAVAAAGRADDAYDLRGPGPAKGQVVTTTSTMKMKDNDLEIAVADQTLKLKQSMNVTTEEEEEYLAVKGRQVTRSKVTVVKEQTKTTVNGQPADKKAGELEGETIVSERDAAGKWTHKLAEGKPTEDQEKQLKKRTGPENEDDLYPEGKVAVGHKWKVDASKMKSLTGGAFTDVKGEMSQTFSKVEKVDGEECALVETTGTMTGKLKDDGDGSPDMELKVTARSWRSLKTGIEVKGDFKGTIKVEGKMKINCQDADMKMAGPIEGTSAAKLKK